MESVSFQGERGAYGEAAAAGFFGGCSTVPCRTFADALGAVTDGRASHAVIPVENSLEGSVGESHDLLYRTGLRVSGEIYHRIEHCLIGGGTLEEARTVYSHPQALGQCRRFIEEKGLRTIPTYDTAGSVRIVRELGRRDCACIASEAASAIHGVPVIARGIADEPGNTTRFLVLSGSCPPPSGRDKTSLIFSIRHEPGSLCRLLEAFHGGGINLTKIESRPSGGGSWEYNFYVDIEGHADDPAVRAALDGAARQAVSSKVLGSYPAA
ncbi:MAG: prephenate dehydratase [Nitrosopumilus sp.]|nr:prephenate dehydratase [Nitrosopumilus sp.]MDA7943508.1 prephenate dehydratase [Nitrosopumilus sp.]MDA7999133.1 prephenate dehydratase [Nitrosopumilus sp.]